MDNRGNIVFNKSRRVNYKKRIGIGFLVLSSMIIGATLSSLVLSKGTVAQGSTEDDEMVYTRNNIPAVIEKIKPSIVTIAAYNDGEDDVNYASGIVYDSNGLIVTVNHIIENKDSINVKLHSGEIIKAVKLGSDKFLDIAVLRVDKKYFNYNNEIKFASNDLKLGEEIVIVSSDYVEGWDTVDKGMISSIRSKKFNYNDKTTEVEMVYSDATASEDNDGAVVINSKGELVGMTNFEMNNRMVQYDYSLMVNTKEFKAAIDSLVRYGFVSRVERGVMGGKFGRAIGGKAAGIYIHEINKDSQADKAGLRPTDIILEINNIQIDSVDQINDVIAECKVGEVIVCKIKRNNSVEQIEIKFEKEN